MLLEDIETFKNHLVVTERREGLTHMVVRRYSDGVEHTINFNDPAYVCNAGTNPEWDSDKLRYGYTSLTTPQSIFEHDLNTRADKLLKQQEVIGTFNPQDYASERIRVKARDGALVPVSMVYHKGTALDGSAPLLLYGYGSYGITVEPRFSSARVSLLDRGFVFAIAHIRGGEGKWVASGTRKGRWNTR